MIQEALEYADSDRERKQRRKRTRAESLTVEAERELKQVALDFMQFARNRQRIETIAVELREMTELTNPKLTFKMRSMS